LARLPVHKLHTNANELNMGSAKVYHLPDWHSLSHPERLVVMRQIATMRGRDPRIAKLALSIIRKSGAKPRQYEKQAAALLKWVQDPRNCYYINEPGERLQDPIYTIKVKHGDCDDMVILLCSLFEAVNLPWKQVLSGRGADGKKVRYIEGLQLPQGASWTHIYCMVGTPPFQPNRWYFCEPTVQGVPLGWDVVDGDHSFLPEMVKRKRGGKQKIMPSPKAPPYFVPPRPPRKGQVSPAYAEAYGQAQVGPVVGAAVAEGSLIAMEAEKGFFDKLDTEKVIVMAVVPIVVGLIVSVGGPLLLEKIRGSRPANAR
jgi:transglutaminase-like putative cysteine protease